MTHAGKLTPTQRFLARLSSADLYSTLRLFSGAPEGAVIELAGKHNFTREQIAGELYKRGRIVPAAE